MSKVTIVKNYRNTVTLKTMDLEEVVNSILTCEYDEAVSLARHTASDTSKLPRVCFATAMPRRASATSIRVLGRFWVLYILFYFIELIGLIPCSILMMSV